MKRTYQPHKKRRLAKHGFLKRSKTKKSRKIILARIKKGRRRISVKKSK